jgi:hypothetical protein
VDGGARNKERWSGTTGVQKRRLPVPMVVLILACEGWSDGRWQHWYCTPGECRRGRCQARILLDVTVWTRFGSRLPTRMENLPAGEARWSVECQTATSHTARYVRYIGPFPPQQFSCTEPVLFLCCRTEATVLRRGNKRTHPNPHTQREDRIRKRRKHAGNADRTLIRGEESCERCFKWF